MATKIKFPEPYRHQHPAIRNVNDLLEEKMTLGQRVADTVARTLGSWKFIIIQSCVITTWIVLNSVLFHTPWDPYPFILLNLFLSLQAAYAAPVLMMSQNRISEKDRIESHNDYQLDIKSEEEIKIIIKHLEAQDLAINRILEILEEKKVIQ
ncbi:MAG TPA: DUF1003 domain-containing protein [Spirochaetota bacterium]|nr:DUF1003 domain-containing protein [Spirochaetota bacterium]HPS86059.1 DUF1003 domain-containing protein [Spirochaetota bacterium]